MSSLKSAYAQLGLPGVFGILVMVAGIAVLSVHSVVAAAGVALVISGIGIVVYSMLRSMMQAFGMMAP